MGVKLSIEADHVECNRIKVLFQKISNRTYWTDPGPKPEYSITLATCHSIFDGKRSPLPFLYLALSLQIPPSPAISQTIRPTFLESFGLPAFCFVSLRLPPPTRRSRYLSRHGEDDTPWTPGRGGFDAVLRLAMLRGRARENTKSNRQRSRGIGGNRVVNGCGDGWGLKRMNLRYFLADNLCCVWKKILDELIYYWQYRVLVA